MWFTKHFVTRALCGEMPNMLLVQCLFCAETAVVIKHTYFDVLGFLHVVSCCGLGDPCCFGLWPVWTEYSWVCPKSDRVSNVVVCVTVLCPVWVCPGLERLGVSVLVLDWVLVLRPCVRSVDWVLVLRPCVRRVTPMWVPERNGVFWQS